LVFSANLTAAVVSSPEAFGTPQCSNWGFLLRRAPTRDWAFCTRRNHAFWASMDSSPRFPPVKAW
jgi:hypothetical protein